jgi:hypothetical protein
MALALTWGCAPPLVDSPSLVRTSSHVLDSETACRSCPSDHLRFPFPWKCDASRPSSTARRRTIRIVPADDERSPKPSSRMTLTQLVDAFMTCANWSSVHDCGCVEGLPMGPT